eukprot:scaffold24122_cov112-Isochrysis_galbana.AAC.1
MISRTWLTASAARLPPLPLRPLCCQRTSPWCACTCIQKHTPSPSQAKPSSKGPASAFGRRHSTF